MVLHFSETDTVADYIQKLETVCALLGADFERITPEDYNSRSFDFEVVPKGRLRKARDLRSVWPKEAING